MQNPNAMQRSSILLAATLAAAGAFAQCPATVGTYDGTPEAGNPHTPFATNTGSSNARGHRVQYIYPAGELLAAGLCAGPITHIAFKAIDTDYAQVGPDGVPGTGDDGFVCHLLTDVRIGHMTLNDFGPTVISSVAALTVDWDPVVESSPNVNTNATLPFLVMAGWVEFPLLTNGFVWDGTSNVVVDVSWVRNFVVGVSPKVELQEGLSYTATKWVQAVLPDLSHGNAYQDNPMGTNTATGTTTTRPVTRFDSGSFNVVVGEPGTTATTISADQASHVLVITRPAQATAWDIVVLDAAGRAIAAERWAAGTEVLRVPIPVGHTGAAIAVATDANGAPIALGTVVFAL